jgi:hypothetical protein
MVLENGADIPDEPVIPDVPIVEDEEPPVPIEQVVTTITETHLTDQQFNYSKPSIKKVYIRVDNEYKQAVAYLSNKTSVVHLNR